MGISESGDQYYWCLRHHRVETSKNVCAARYRMGPYASPADAERAMETVRERNDAWDEEDARWEGEAK